MTAQLAPFESKNELPEWRLIYEALPREFGAVITYEQLDEILGRDFRSNRNPIYRAQQELLEVDERAMEVVENKGYRIVEAREQETLAKKDHRGAKRKIRRAIGKVVHVEKAKLTIAERGRFEAMELGLKRQQAALRRLETKVEKQQQQTDANTAELDQMRARISQLEEALRRHGYTEETT